MKCFVVLAALTALASAKPQFGLLARRGLIRGLPRRGVIAANLDPVLNGAARVSYGIGAPIGAAPLIGRAALPLPGAVAHVAPVRVATPVVAKTHIAPAAVAAPVVSKTHIAPAAIATPVAVAAPAPAIAPVTSSQYHTQDEAGNYEYGYSNINSEKVERGNSRLGVEGSYSYIDGYGLKQRVNYVADALGFRATGTNVGIEGALGRKKREIAYGAIDPIAFVGLPAAVDPAGYSGAPFQVAAAPPAGAVAPAADVAIVPSAPAAREAIVTFIDNTPGHATSYIVN